MRVTFSNSGNPRHNFVAIYGQTAARYVGPVRFITDQHHGDLMKLILTLGLLLTPTLVFAKRDRDRDRWSDDKDDRINATEMVTTGSRAAGLIGAAGYLVLRYRKLAIRNVSNGRFCNQP